MHYAPVIKRIVKSKTGLIVKEIKENHKGFDNMVYIVETSGGRLVVKFPTKQKRSKVLSEAWALRQWTRLGVPVPKVLDTGRDYIIEEFVPGKQMGEADLSPTQTREVMEDLGRFAKKMHSVRTRKFGYLIEEGVGGNETWTDFMDPFFKKIMTQLKVNRIVDDKTLNRAMNFYVRNSEGPLEFDDPRLVHADLTQSNIVVDKGSIRGIIDATSAISGDPMFDVAVVNQNCYGTDLIDSFVQGYGKIDDERVLFYSLYQSVWLAHFAAVQTRDRALAQKAIASMKHYLDKEPL